MSVIVGVPDMLRNSRSIAEQARLQQDLRRVQQELTTGLQADRVKASGGDTAQLMGIERVISEIEGRLPQLGVASSRAAATQTAMEVVVADTAQLAVRLTDDSLRNREDLRRVRAIEAETALQQTLAALNTSVGGDALFAGAAADGPAIRSTDMAFPDAAAKIVDDLRALIDAAPDVATAITDIDDYFDAGGDFETNLLRVNGDYPGVELDDGARAAYAVTADETAFRDIIKGLATVVATTRSTLAGQTDDTNELFDAAGAAIFSGEGGVIELKASLGAVERRMEDAVLAQQAERTTLQIAFDAILGRDEFEAATELQQIETQIEALYLLTSRSAALSFTNYLR